MLCAFWGLLIRGLVTGPHQAARVQRAAQKSAAARSASAGIVDARRLLEKNPEFEYRVYLFRGRVQGLGGGNNQNWVLGYFCGRLRFMARADLPQDPL